MPMHFLRGEVARLVMSYILEEDLQLTAQQFMQESRDLPQEFKEFPAEDLKECCCVNQRNLVEILKEYVGVCNELKLIAFDLDPQMYNQHKFDPPDRLLKSVVGQLKAKQAENAPTVPVKKAEYAPTGPVPAKQVENAPPPMPVVQQVSGLAKPANPAGGPAQAKQVETVPPPKPVDQQVSGQAKLTNPVGGNNPVVATIGGRLDTSDDHMDSSVHDFEVENSPNTSLKSANTTTNQQTVGKKSKRGVSSSPKKPRELRPKTRYDINRANPEMPEITLTLPPVSIAAHSFNPVVGNQIQNNGQVCIQIPPGMLANAQPNTTITLPPVPAHQFNQSLQYQTQQQVPANFHQVHKPGMVKPVQPIQPMSQQAGTNQATIQEQGQQQVVNSQQKKKQKDDSDDEFIKGLLGELGETIASIIPPTVDKEKIGDVANTALDNPDLYQGLYNLVDTCQQLELSFASLEDPSSRISTPIPPEELVDVETISPQKNSEPIKDSTDILSKAIDATNDKNELPPKQVSDKNPPTEKSNVNKDNTKNVNQSEKAKNSVSENSPNVKENEIQKKKNTPSDYAMEADKSIEKEKPSPVATKEVTESPSKRRSRKGKPRSNTEIILKEFTQAVKASQETKTSEERIEQENNDQDTNVEDNHIENNSDKENAPNETKEMPDAALSANRIQNDTEPAVKKTPPVSGLLGKLINISKAQKTPAADTEKNKADLNTFRRRIGSLVRLQTVNISEDDKNNENTADAANKAKTTDTTRTKVKKQIRPRSLDGTADENQSTIISRQRLSSSSDNERNTERKDRIKTNMNPMQVSETGKLSENVLKGSKAGMTLPVSGPIGSITVEKLRSESSSQSDSDNNSKSSLSTNTSGNTSNYVLGGQTADHTSVQSADHVTVQPANQARGAAQGQQKRKRKTCGRCDGCKSNCGKCKVCVHNPKFGGNWEKFKKKACVGRVCLNPRPVVIELVEVEQPEEAVKEEVILDTVVDKVSIGNEQFSPSKIPIVIATYPSQVHHTPSVSSQNVSISSYHFKQPLPLDQLREMVCSSDNNTPGGSKSSAIKQPVLTSTPISMSAIGISRLQRAISTAISSSLNASQTTLAKSLTTTAAATHVRNLMFSPPDKVPKVEELDSSEVDNSVLSNLSEGSKSWAVIHATDDTDLKDEVKDEVEVINIEDKEESIVEEIKKAVPTTQQEKTLLKISYSPTKGYKARTRRVPNILRRSPNSKGKPGTTLSAAGLPGFQHPATEPSSILPGTTVFLNNPSSSGLPLTSLTVARSSLPITSLVRPSQQAGTSSVPGVTTLARTAIVPGTSVGQQMAQFQISIDPQYLMKIHNGLPALPTEPLPPSALASFTSTQSTTATSTTTTTTTTLTSLINAKPKDMITTTTSLLSLPGNSSIPTGSAAAKPLTASAKPLTAEQKKKAAMAWDEKIRACLTDIEKDTSHITKHVKERQVRRQAQYKRKRSESEEEDEGEDTNGPNEPDGNSQDPLNPEIEKEIYSISKTLLQGVEDNEAKSGAKKGELKLTINKQAIKDAKNKVKKDRRDKSKEKQPRNEIKKDENINPTSQQPLPVAPLASLAPAVPLVEAMPLLLTSPLKSVPTNYTPKRTSNSSKPLKKRSLKLSESEKESQIKELGAVANDADALTTVIEDIKEPPVISINEEGFINEMQPAIIKEPTKEVELDIPVTPKKQEDLTFKTPHKKSPQGRRSPSLLKTPKTPRSHLPLSSIQELLSPIAGFRRAVPKTPKSKQKEDPASSQGGEPERQKSSIDTPVLESPVGGSPPPPYSGHYAPTTPKGIKTTSVPYYTPSPSTRDSFAGAGPSPGGGAVGFLAGDTPGLKYLKDEGDRLSSSQGEESRSPRRMDVKKKCRKNFKDAFASTGNNAASRKLSSTQVGLLVEKGLNYSMSTKMVTDMPCTPEHSTANNYKESPNLILTAPSTTTTPRGNARGFNSPNRTRYLSPDAVNLGFSPTRAGRAANTDSESDHLVIAASESEAENKKKTEQVVDKDKKSKRKETKILDVSPISTRAKRGVKVNLNSDLTDTESASKPPVIKPLILPAAAKPSEAVVKPLGGAVSTVVPPPEVLNDNAVHDDGESLEDIQRAVAELQQAHRHHSTLTNEASCSMQQQPTSLPTPFLSNTSSNQMNLSEEDTDDDSELEEAAKDQTIQSNQDSFIQAFKAVTKKKSDLVKPLALSTPMATRSTKGRRVPLMSTTRISPLKGGSSTWEAMHDAHNLDNKRPAKRRAGSVTTSMIKKRRTSDEDTASAGGCSGSHEAQAEGIVPVRQSSDTRSSSNSGLTVKIGETSMNESKELQITVSPRKSTRLADKKKALEKHEDSDNEDSETIHSSSSSDNSDNDSSSDDNTDISSANEHANDELSEQDDMDVAKARENDNKEVTIELENKAIPGKENNEKKTDVDIEATVNVQVENVQKTEASIETIEQTAIDVKTIKVQINGITLTYQKLFQIS